MKRERQGSGYWFVIVRGHPMADSRGRIQEHRYVMAEYLRRPLRADEVVHHKDGNRENNDLSNLEVMTSGDHTRHHHPQKLVVTRCNNCGTTVIRAKRKINGRRVFCSYSCSSSFYGRNPHLESGDGSVKKELPHGMGRYRKGCRCRKCRAANAERIKQYRDSRPG